LESFFDKPIQLKSHAYIQKAHHSTFHCNKFVLKNDNPYLKKYENIVLVT